MRHLLIVLLLPVTALGSTVSIGPLGIDSIGLLGPNGELLTGVGAKIGQVEPQRPVDPDVDDLFVNDTINPAQVSVQQQLPDEDEANAAPNHPTWVAGVMISSDGTARGVATGASLYADAYVNPVTTDVVQPLKSIQYVSTIADGEVRAINNSWGHNFPDADGTSQLSLGVDWLADRYNVLLVFAVNPVDRPDFDAPGDNYNGITVASSDRFDSTGDGVGDGNGVYRQVASGNDFEEFYFRDHYETDLLASGINIALTGVGGLASNSSTDDGSSFAAPHVVGTVALLQQYAELEIVRPGTTWNDIGPRRHEVMKAVLLNSADKISGVQGSMRTVVDQAGNDWEDSQAFADPDIPLDPKLGAGHLNARRALTQFRAGPIDDAEGQIDKIGWHFGETAGPGTTFTYRFAEPLIANEYASITLAWDRRISKTGPIANVYGAGDTFADTLLNDLDLYLLPVGWESLNEAVAESTGVDENIEHIFAKVPTGGDYEIYVEHGTFLGGDDLKFGLAWWIGDAPAAPIPGDFNGSGGVDGADLSSWRGSFGPGGGADADGDGDSDGDDFLTWQRNLGMGSAVPVAAAVPEPDSIALAALAACALVASVRRR